MALALIVPRLVEEPLRRTVERNVNQQLKGYRVTIGELGLQPLALAIQLFDVRIVQEAHPKPAVAELPRFRASVQWRAVLHGKLVGDGASHAWMAVWSPPYGWIEFDPTNGCFAGTDHVAVAWGRDFGDVSPLRGVILGGADHQLTGTVLVEPVETAPP